MYQDIPIVEEKESSPPPAKQLSLAYLPPGTGGGGGVTSRGTRPKRHEKRSSSSQRMEGLRRSPTNLQNGGGGGVGCLSSPSQLGTIRCTSASSSSAAVAYSHQQGTHGDTLKAVQSAVQSPSMSYTTNLLRSHPVSSPLYQNKNNTFEIDMKVVVLGQGNCGKSSLISKLVHGTFARVRPPSIGVDFQSRSFELEFPGLARLKRQYTKAGCSPPQVVLKMNLWDIAGQEDCGIGTSTYYQGAKAAIIVYDVTNPTSLAKALAWKRDLDRKASFDENGVFRIPAILVGNKADLVAYPLPLGDSQAVYQRSRRSSVAKAAATSVANNTHLTSSSRHTTTRSSHNSADASSRGSYGGGGARSSNAVEEEGDEGEDGLGHSLTNTDPHRWDRSSSRIVNAEAAAMALLQVESMDNSPNGFVSIAIAPKDRVRRDSLVGTVSSPLDAIGVGSKAHASSRSAAGSNASYPSDGPTTPRNPSGNGGTGMAGRTVSDSRGFLTPVPFHHASSRGDNLDAMCGDEDRGRDSERFFGSEREYDNGSCGALDDGEFNNTRPRTPKRMSYENRSRRNSNTSIGTPGLKSPTAPAHIPGGIRSPSGGFSTTTSARTLDALPTTTLSTTAETITYPQYTLPPNGCTTCTGSVSAIDVSSPRDNFDAVDPLSPVVSDGSVDTTSPQGSTIGASTTTTRFNPNLAIQTTTPSELRTPVPPMMTPSPDVLSNSMSGRSSSSVALNLRRSHQHHQLQQTALFLQQQQESRTVMPETKQQIEDFINEHRFVGHFFSSARSGLCVDEIAEYTLHSILKMDPHGTDDIEAHLRGEAAAGGGSGVGSPRLGGGGSRIGGSSGRITKATMSASPSRRGKKNRQQTRFGGCVVQ